MEARITNAISVNRVWGDSEESELLAVFQYERDAEAFARWRIEDDANHGYGTSSFYVCSCGFSGKIKLFRPTSLNTDKRDA